MNNINLKLYFTFCFLLLIYNQKNYSQTSKIEYYTFTKNTIDTTGIRSYLLFNNNKSLFIWKSIFNRTEKSKNISDDDEINIKKIYNDTIGTRVLYKYSDNKIILREPLLDVNFTVIDSKVKLDWILLDEFKNIESFQCQKATAYFRGRNYIAWFTHQIPIPTGPWKIIGLPGLVIEAYDENREVNFLFKSFQYKTSNQEEIEISFDENSISIKEFVKEKDNLQNKIINEALSKLPRGVKVESSSNNKRKGLELIYEWEQ